MLYYFKTAVDAETVWALKGMTLNVEEEVVKKSDEDADKAPLKLSRKRQAQLRFR